MLGTLRGIRAGHTQTRDLVENQTLGTSLSPPAPRPPLGSRAALTVCHGTAIRHASQINSRPVQENCQLTARDNTAFVLRLQVQGQLCVLHCRTQKATRMGESKCTRS